MPGIWTSSRKNTALILWATDLRWLCRSGGGNCVHAKPGLPARPCPLPRHDWTTVRRREWGCTNFCRSRCGRSPDRGGRSRGRSLWQMACVHSFRRHDVRTSGCLVKRGKIIDGCWPPIAGCGKFGGGDGRFFWVLFKTPVAPQKSQKSVQKLVRRRFAGGLRRECRLRTCSPDCG